MICPMFECMLVLARWYVTVQFHRFRCDMKRHVPLCFVTLVLRWSVRKQAPGAPMPVHKGLLVVAAADVMRTDGTDLPSVCMNTGRSSIVVLVERRRQGSTVSLDRRSADTWVATARLGPGRVHRAA